MKKFSANAVKTLWPGSFLRNDTTGDKYRVESYFCGDSESSRYPMDEVYFRLGFYQYDTDQDAIYYGCWVCPESLQIVEYAEGDIQVVTCNSAELYKEYLGKMNGKLDDHDGQHWQKLEKT